MHKQALLIGMMIPNPSKIRFPYESLVTALAIGGFFIILSLVFALTPSFSQVASGFFSDLTTVMYPIESSNGIYLPAPANPAQHMLFYNAVATFFLGMGVLQIVILMLRFWIKSKINKIAEAVGNLVFWWGATIMANVLLLIGTLNGWFQFWASLIIFVGVSLVSQFLVFLINKRRSTIV